MANLIKIKRSTTTDIPASLANGEMAYTANGDILYIGSNSAIVAIAGGRTPGTLTANQALVANSLSLINTVKVGRSADNTVISNAVVTIANSTVSFALSLPTAGQAAATNYYIGADGIWHQLTGGATTLSGLTDVTITSAANNDLFVYDGTAAKWINKAVGNGVTFASQSLSVLANNGIVSNTSGVWAKGANGISVTAAGINVLGNTGVTVNTSGVFIGQDVGTSASVTFGTINTTDLTVSGNLTVTGTLTAVDTTNMAVNDSIIELARNNSSNVIDIGFYGAYNDGTARFTGLLWDASTLSYELFSNTATEPTTTLNIAGTGYVRALLHSYLNTGALVANSSAVNITANSTVSSAIVANTLTLTTALGPTSGGTGIGTYALGDLIVGSGVNTLTSLPVGAAGKVLQANSTTVTYDDLDGGTF